MSDHEGESFTYESVYSEEDQNFDNEDDDHCAIFYGAKRLRRNIYDFGLIANNYYDACSIVNDWEQKHGPDVLVRIRKDLLWDVDLEGRFTVRDFIVLCGILGPLGADTIKQISYERIQQAASGCKSASVFQRERQRNHITNKQVITAAEKLDKRGIMRSVTVKKRFRYYSIRVGSSRELKELVIQHLKTKAQKEAKRSADRSISDLDL